jgi:hypothetical protein
MDYVTNLDGCGRAEFFLAEVRHKSWERACLGRCWRVALGGAARVFGKLKAWTMWPPSAECSVKSLGWHINTRLPWRFLREELQATRVATINEA